MVWKMVSKYKKEKIYIKTETLPLSLAASAQLLFPPPSLLGRSPFSFLQPRPIGPSRAPPPLGLATGLLDQAAERSSPYPSPFFP